VGLTVQQLAAAGVPDPARVLAAAAACAGWLEAAPPGSAIDGLAAAADPAGALHALARLLEEATPALEAAEVVALLRLLGGSPALATALAAEAAGWPAALRGVLAEERRDTAAHRRALDALGVVGALPRDTLHARLRLYRCRELLRV